MFHVHPECQLSLTYAEKWLLKMLAPGLLITLLLVQYLLRYALYLLASGQVRLWFGQHGWEHLWNDGFHSKVTVIGDVLACPECRWDHGIVVRRDDFRAGIDEGDVRIAHQLRSSRVGERDAQNFLHVRVLPRGGCPGSQLERSLCPQPDSHAFELMGHAAIEQQSTPMPSSSHLSVSALLARPDATRARAPAYVYMYCIVTVRAPRARPPPPWKWIYA